MYSKTPISQANKPHPCPSKHSKGKNPAAPSERSWLLILCDYEWLQGILAFSRFWAVGSPIMPVPIRPMLSIGRLPISPRVGEGWLLTSVRCEAARRLAVAQPAASSRRTANSKRLCRIFLWSRHRHRNLTILAGYISLRQLRRQRTSARAAVERA